MKKKILALTLAGSLIAFGAAAALGAEKLSLTQCVAAALQNHPSLTAAEGTVESKKAMVTQAAVSSRMKASATGAYARTGSGSNNSGDWNSGLSLSQNLYDWGKSGSAIESASLTKQAAEATLLNTRNTVIADVKDAYYGLNKATREIAVLKEQVKNYQQRLDWAKAYYAAGTKAKIEVTKAEADLANAQLALIQSESSQEQYKAQLASAMGSPSLDIETVSDELDYQKWTIALDEALKQAAEKRPDLTAQDLLVQKAKTDIKAASLTNAPDLTASAGYSFGGAGAFDDDQWTAKLNLEFKFGDGGQTKAKIAQTKADLKVAQANRDKLAQDIVLDVRKAWQSLRESAASISAAQAAERQAKETLDLALGRYKAGVGDSLEISDAVNGYATAQTKVISCLYQHRAARLSLEKAMGEVSGS